MNPFATRFVRLGQIPFLGMSLEEFDEILRCWQRQGFTGQIVGPHGSGKSTLACTLVQRLQTHLSLVQTKIPWSHLVIAGANRVRNLAVPAPKYRLGGSMPHQNTPAETPSIDIGRRLKRVLVVDGIERTTLANRIALIRHCRRNHCGLMITTHRRLRWLPVLCRVKPSVESLLALVRHLAPELQGRVGYRLQDLQTLFHEQSGDLREILMSLYDRYEDQQPTRMAAHS